MTTPIGSESADDAAEAQPADADDAAVVRFTGLSVEPLDVVALSERVRTDASGAIALFVGVVRDHDGGRAVTHLSYSAHPSAERTLRDVVTESVRGTGAQAVAAEHRIGDLVVGDAAVVVAVACAHRAEAFAICHRVIDAVKAEVPIWKHQRFADGTDEWVGSPG